MNPPAPPRVDDMTRFWGEPPVEPSTRCLWWQGRIEAGWRPNARINGMGYDEAAAYFGVYIWEYLNILYPMLEKVRRTAET